MKKRKELEKEAEKKCKLNDQIHRDCFVDGYIKAAEPREKRIAELEKKNADLKADNDARKFAMAMSEKVEKQLREENAELKNERNAFKIYSEGAELDAINLNEQLTKAKELLEDFICYANLADCNLYIKEEAEQFLSEVKKC